MSAQGQQGPADGPVGGPGASQAAAPADVEQHRLGPVVGGVAHAHVVGQGGIAGSPGPGLQVGAGLHGDGSQLEAASDPVGHRPGGGRVPARVGSQPVVHVPGGDLQSGRGGQNHQRAGVGAARQPAIDGARRVRERASPQHLSDLRGIPAAARRIRPTRAAAERLRRLSAADQRLRPTRAAAERLRGIPAAARRIRPTRAAAERLRRRHLGPDLRPPGRNCLCGPSTDPGP